MLPWVVPFILQLLPPDRCGLLQSRLLAMNKVALHELVLARAPEFAPPLVDYLRQGAFNCLRLRLLADPNTWSRQEVADAMRDSIWVSSPSQAYSLLRFAIAHDLLVRPNDLEWLVNYPPRTWRVVTRWDVRAFWRLVERNAKVLLVEASLIQRAWDCFKLHDSMPVQGL